MYYKTRKWKNLVAFLWMPAIALGEKEGDGERGGVLITKENVITADGALANHAHSRWYSLHHVYETPLNFLNFPPSSPNTMARMLYTCHCGFIFLASYTLNFKGTL